MLGALLASVALIAGAPEEVTGEASVSATGYLAESGRNAYTSLVADLYLSSLVDDDAPRSLQPFLQRRTLAELQVSGSVVADDATLTSGSYRSRSLGAAARLSGYPTRGLYLGGELYATARRFTQNPSPSDPQQASPGAVSQTNFTPGGAAVVGYRGGDTLLSVRLFQSWERAGGAWFHLGGVTFSARTIIARRLDLDANVFLQQDVVEPWAHATFYFTQDFGIGCGVLYEHYGSGLVTREIVQPSVVANYWVTSAIGISATYALESISTTTSGRHAWAQTLTAGAWSRF